ncbi:hypothetical protein TNCV_2837401 [Trichonephila clavipes]|nr:hypothetical protein TNCV_2837401 [Trichonephila clavipes]
MHHVEVLQPYCVCRTTDGSVIAGSSAARAVKSVSCSRYHVPKARPSKRKMQALLKAKKRWGSGQLELEHPSLHDNDPNASGPASSNYEKNAKVNICTLNSSELMQQQKESCLFCHTLL